jgi:hypothetical protein
MNKTIILALLAASVVMPFAAHASTGDCDSKGTPALGIVSIGGMFYIDDRNYLLGNGLWVYQESNGISDLQRGGSSQIVPDDNEICTDDANVPPDQLIE